MRAVLLVRPGLDFFSLVFALFKAGVVPVVIDPGIGLRSLAQCCREAAPEAFIGIPRAIAAHWVFGWGRKTVRRVVWVGPGLPNLGDGDHDACRGAQGGQGRPGTAARRRASCCSAIGRRAGGDPVHKRQHGPAQGGRLYSFDFSVAGEGVPLVL